MTTSKGIVYIVGAGPGDLAYLTIGGQQLLTQAEVILYDALVQPQLLRLASANCMCRPVGKRGQGPSTPQTEINQLLIHHCQQGKRVVRLKTGDPYVFGRTTAERQALTAAGCNVVVLPGVSAALAAPLLAGIPLTDPTLSRSFTVVSAHNPSRLDWATLAAVDTLVILMGGKQLPEIGRQLLHQGLPSQHPVAIIRQGGWDNQQLWVGTLAEIGVQTAGVILSPAVIVVGQVVTLCSGFTDQTWASSPLAATALSPSFLSSATMPNPSPDQPDTTVPKPLIGKTVLVTRSASQSGTFSDRLRSAGATVLEMPALEIGAPSSWVPLDEAIANLNSFDWVVLTSTNGVSGFMERLLHQGKDARTLHTLKIAVVGRKTANSLKQYGLQPDFVPSDFVADSLADEFPGNDNLTGTTLLFPRVETGGRDVLVAQLTAKGAQVVEVPAYQSRCPESMDPEIVAAIYRQDIDVITFASSKTVKHFCQLFQQALANEINDGSSHPWQQYLQIPCLASIGPQTSQTCVQLLDRVDLEAREYTLEGLAQGIIYYFEGLGQDI